MQLILTIAVDNAAFEGEDGPVEVGRILRRAADRFVDLYDTIEVGHALALRDVNGNVVGDVTVEE